MAAGEKTVATNRRAWHDYEIDDVYEAGIVLTGSEVKSLRGGKASLSEAYGRVSDNEIWLEGLHIPPYAQDSTRREYDPRRPRKLLLRRVEIERLKGKLNERGYTLVPLRVYFSHGLAKLEVGVGRGKRRYEKRQAIAEREHKREIEREMARRNR
ncbi:MAG TPA: SsrA-binding protein SmpB [Actinomycetota bacterium]|nr:SsrA-binding protein SmpB [Actinomycetota bacterium]